MKRPEAGEYQPYYDGYISQVNEGEDLLAMMAAQPEQLRSLFEQASEDRGTHAYEDGKWTIKEVLSHINDGERMFAYRVLRVSRGDETPIEGFDQNNGYIENSNANNQSFAELLDAFELQRKSNVILLRNMSDEAAARIGTANEKQISARALAYIMAGHVRHHANILKERYLV
jgi:uncharacterized damage-inducible protein DinB